MEQGEQNSAYFFRLEKSNANYNSMSKLNVDGIITHDPKTISNYCYNIYKLLYTSRVDEYDTFSFLDSITLTLTLTLTLRQAPVTCTALYTPCHFK